MLKKTQDSRHSKSVKVLVSAPTDMNPTTSINPKKGIHYPGQDMNYMKGNKTYKGEQKAFKNKFALVRTYTKKLNRENALAAK